MTAPRLTFLITLIALAMAILSFYKLESVRNSVATEDVMFGQTPATVYTHGASSGKLVIVSHGFAGSRQMMQAISLTLARAGHDVVAFDYLGHGRHTQPLSPAVQTVTGTTGDLVLQTLDVVAQSKELTGLSRVALVGHSMATDVIVRAAKRDPSIDDVVAISMYSDAVTPSHPERLLIVLGAFEGRLRDVALEAVGQIGPAKEGVTTEDAGVVRRAVVAPRVGHVGVLWSRLTLAEVTCWLGNRASVATTGPWIVLLLLSLILLFRPLASLLPEAKAPPCASLRSAAAAALISAIPAGALAATGLPLFGLAGFGALGLAFGVWGLLVLAILRLTPSPTWRGLCGATLLTLWGLAVFALALDRYAAAFVPTGPRLTLALSLLPALLVFGLADRILVEGRGVLARISLRAPFLLALLLAMIANPAQLGLTFTVLPVLVMFWLVYGTMALWVAKRSGPFGAGVGAGVILAWAIAASTPLFYV